MRNFTAGLEGNNSSGAVATEFILGFPLLVLLFMFMVDAGLYLFQKAVLTDTTTLLNRAIVTHLGQREAEAAKLGTPPPSCDDLRDDAEDIKDRIKTTKFILFKDSTFRLQVSKKPELPFRLVTTEGSKDFNCLTCRFFSSLLPPIVSRAVLVIERPDDTNIFCQLLDSSLETAIP